MTRQKDLKRAIRARMRKTGEAYTAARAQLLGETAALQTTPRSSATSQPEIDYAKLAGMSDDAVRAKTGDDWKRWVEALDSEGAADWPHREIAKYVQATGNLSGWWAQTVTVGYERIKGLREIGQRRGGDYESSKSRTFAVPLSELFDAWADGRRERWLPVSGLRILKAIENRSLRMAWPDGTAVDLWFTAKGPAKSTVQVHHRKLASKAEAERRKRYWGERLDALAASFAAA